MAHLTNVKARRLLAAALLYLCLMGTPCHSWRVVTLVHPIRLWSGDARRAGRICQRPVYEPPSK